MLRRLGESLHAASTIPHLSIVAAEDSVVTELAALEVGELLVIEDSGHNGLLYHPRVAQVVAERVQRFRAPASPSR